MNVMQFLANRIVDFVIVSCKYVEIERLKQMKFIVAFSLNWTIFSSNSYRYVTN